MFYKTVLGFTGTDMGTYAVLKKENTELHFQLGPAEKLQDSPGCYIRVSDIQCLFGNLAAKGYIYPENQLKDLPGHKKGFTLKDNNGILLRFIQES